MPEKGWYSLIIRKETVLKVRELAKNKGLTVDELINEFMKPPSKGVWSTCTLRARSCPGAPSEFPQKTFLILFRPLLLCSRPRDPGDLTV